MASLSLGALFSLVVNILELVSHCTCLVRELDLDFSALALFLRFQIDSSNLGDVLFGLGGLSREAEAEETSSI